MGSAHDDLWALSGLADFNNVGLDAGRVIGTLVRDLLRLRQQRLNSTKVKQCVARIGLLNHAGDDVTLTARVLFVLQLSLSLTDPLRHHLTSGLGSDAAEVVGRDVELLTNGFAFFVKLLGEDPELERVGVNRDPGILACTRHPLVRGLQRIGERSKERVNADASFDSKRLQRFHHLLVHDMASSELGRSFLGPPSFGVGPHSKTVRAFEISV